MGIEGIWSDFSFEVIKHTVQYDVMFYRFRNCNVGEVCLLRVWGWHFQSNVMVFQWWVVWSFWVVMVGYEEWFNGFPFVFVLYSPFDKKLCCFLLEKYQFYYNKIDFIPQSTLT